MLRNRSLPDPGVVHEHVDRPELVHRSDRASTAAPAYVRRDPGRFPAGIGYVRRRVDRRVLVGVIDDDARPVVDRFVCRRSAGSATRIRCERRSVVQVVANGGVLTDGSAGAG